MARPNRKMIPLDMARWRLGTLWFASSGLLFSLLIIQSLAGVYEDRVQSVWGWALPNILPTLLLMVGVFAGAALVEDHESDHLMVRRPFYRLSIALSAFHLLSVATTLAAYPFVGATRGDQENTMSLFDTSNLWLGPLQGLVAAVMAVLFFTKTGEKVGRGSGPENVGGANVGDR